MALPASREEMKADGGDDDIGQWAQGSTQPRCDGAVQRHRQLVGPSTRYGHGLIGRAGPHDQCQAAVAMPVIWFQVVNRSVISRRYSATESRWRPGRKCGEMPVNADKNR